MKKEKEAIKEEEAKPELIENPEPQVGPKTKAWMDARAVHTEAVATLERFRAMEGDYRNKKESLQRDLKHLVREICLTDDVEKERLRSPIREIWLGILEVDASIECLASQLIPEAEKEAKDSSRRSSMANYERLNAGFSEYR